MGNSADKNSYGKESNVDEGLICKYCKAEFQLTERRISHQKECSAKDQLANEMLQHKNQTNKQNLYSDRYAPDTLKTQPILHTSAVLPPESGFSSIRSSQTTLKSKNEEPDVGTLKNQTSQLDIDSISLVQQEYSASIGVRHYSELEQSINYECFDFRSTKSSKLDKNGGTIEVGGCSVIVPPDALEDDVTITVAAYYGGNENKRLTPLLSCEPHGLTFKKKVKIILPTCYKANSPVRTIVRFSEDGDKWGLFVEGRQLLSSQLTFYTTHFSWFDVIIETGLELSGLIKEKALILGVFPEDKVNPPKIISSVLICDNLEIAKDLKGLNNAFETTFYLSYIEQDLNVTIYEDNLKVEPDKILLRGVWNKSREESQFLIKMKDGSTLDHQSMKIRLLPVAKVDKTVFFRPGNIRKQKTEQSFNFKDSNLRNCAISSDSVTYREVQNPLENP